MYYIPNEWWDGYLSADIPKLYLGASYVDRWISRAMQKVDSYENLVGYIDHETHPKPMAAGSDAIHYYQKTSAPTIPGQKEIGLRLFQRPLFFDSWNRSYFGPKGCIKKNSKLNLMKCHL
jgi:hypothetical protein